MVSRTRIKIFIIFLVLFFSGIRKGFCQVIDVHLHGYTGSDFFTGKARNGFESSRSAKEHLEQTIQEMNKNNIEWAVICGSMESLDLYTKADKRFIPGYQDYQDTLIPATSPTWPSVKNMVFR